MAIGTTGHKTTGAEPSTQTASFALAAPMTFREIYDAHLLFVWRTLRRLGVAEADAHDAAQEVFLVVFRRLPEFEWRAKITTWLFRICLRVASERLRRSPTRREVATDDFLDSADPNADAGADAEKREALAILEKAFSRMDFNQRAVFTLFELEGMTGEEVASTLQVPLGTVYSRLRFSREIFQSTVRREVECRPIAAVAGGKR